ncbi:MAG: lysozyme inhibitor LprI family protein [Neisseria zoodegmatis]|uniref:lysozyme inhibitor LprI family protein n=1 Tax=Neisseria zoodegmatis TaxID=326523 RepID=UPI0026ED6A55|nr:lysozyme inhibitor LprI family protein [Neisseria zoodegmatis]MDO5068980.1 lysozyme inhibitor LprI family protein [Neisseria zoodegmatis]
MYKKLLTLSLIATALTACSDDAPTQQANNKLECNNPAVAHNIRANVQEIIKQEAQSYARKDSRQFIDPDKIIAAATQLNISLNNPQETQSNGNTVCTAGLNIQIPNDILNTAQTNSPLLYNNRSISQLMQERLTGSQLTYDDKGGFSRPLSYTLSVSDGQTTVNYEDNGLIVAAKNIATALIPYGIKSILMIDGKAVPLKDALNLNNQPHAEPPQADPEDILDNNAASNVFDQEETPAPEILSPEPKRTEVTFSANELEQAKQNNQAANNEINRLWNNMEQPVQKELLGEQRSWIQSKTNHCRQAATQAETPLQAEYLRLQCDTRMTRERSQYLRGYTIH